MSESAPEVRREIAVAALARFPPRLRKTLIADRSFREELALDRLVTVGNCATFRRSDFLGRARKLVWRDGTENLEAVEGGSWTLVGRAGSGTLEMQHGTDRFVLPDFSLLSEDPKTR